MLHPNLTGLIPYFFYYLAESSVLETHTFYCTHPLAEGIATSAIYSPYCSYQISNLYNLFDLYLLFMRKDEVPTPKHFTVPLVFKTRLNPIQLPFHLPNHRCDIGLSYKRGRL